MRAVRFHGVGDLRIEDVPVPKAPDAGEVRLRVRAAGICGSDLHNFKTGQWVSRLPVTPGHEFAAEVLEVGAGVAGLKVGRSGRGRLPRTLRPLRNCRRAGIISAPRSAMWAKSATAVSPSR